MDTSVKVTYSSKSRTEGKPCCSFAAPSKTTTRTFATAIADGPFYHLTDLIVRGTVPVGIADGIQNRLRKPEGIAHAQDGEGITVKLAGQKQNATVWWSKVEDRMGGETDRLYELVCKMKTSETIQLKTEWKVRVLSI